MLRSPAAGDSRSHGHFHDTLCSEWMTKEEAMRLMGVSSACAFQNRVRNHGIGTLVIGHTSLARSTDVVRSLRRQGG
jgi:hypothetical protein